jgi:hypothetical protein
LPNTLQNGLKIQGSHNRGQFAKHFTKWLQLHQRRHYIRAVAAISATVEALPKGAILAGTFLLPSNNLSIIRSAAK